MHLLLGNTSDHTILEVDDERDETEPMNPYHYQGGTMSHSVLETSNRNTKVNSALSMNEKGSGERDMKVKLENVISILSSMKNDFN